VALTGLIELVGGVLVHLDRVAPGRNLTAVSVFAEVMTLRRLRQALHVHKQYHQQLRPTQPLTLSEIVNELSGLPNATDWGIGECSVITGAL